MYLLDTSVVSNFLDERRYYPQLTARILSQPPEEIFISIITHKIVALLRSLRQIILK